MDVQAAKTGTWNLSPSNSIPSNIGLFFFSTASLDKTTSRTGELRHNFKRCLSSPIQRCLLALAFFSAAPAYAAETEQLTFNGKPSVIVCAVLHLCDIELQQGEVITGLQVGDRARWSITPAITGSGSNEIHHIVVRPFDVDLETSAVVATTRRTYHLQLRSDASRYMPRVQFTYPEEAQRKIEAKVSSELHDRQRGLIPETNQYIGDLDFQYRVQGVSQLKPLRVYNDHLKTTIELPPSLTEQPSLVITEAGRVGDKAMGYSRQGSHLLVDGVFDSAVLVYGSGGEKNTVSVDRLQKTGSGAGGSIATAPTLPPSKKSLAPAVVSIPPQMPPAITPVGRSIATEPPAQEARAFASKTLVATVEAKAPIGLTSPGLKLEVPKPPKLERWEAKKGSTLRESVTNWAKRAGWDLNWNAVDLDYPIDAPIQLEGSFEDVIGKLFPLYDQAQRSFQVKGSRAQKLLIISEKPTRSPQ